MALRPRPTIGWEAFDGDESIRVRFVATEVVLKGKWKWPGFWVSYSPNLGGDFMEGHLSIVMLRIE